MLATLVAVVLHQGSLRLDSEVEYGPAQAVAAPTEVPVHLVGPRAVLLIPGRPATFAWVDERDSLVTLTEGEPVSIVAERAFNFGGAPMGASAGFLRWWGGTSGIARLGPTLPTVRAAAAAWSPASVCCNDDTCLIVDAEGSGGTWVRIRDGGLASEPANLVGAGLISTGYACWADADVFAGVVTVTPPNPGLVFSEFRADRTLLRRVYVPFDTSSLRPAIARLGPSYLVVANPNVALEVASDGGVRRGVLNLDAGLLWEPTLATAGGRVFLFEHGSPVAEIDPQALALGAPVSWPAIAEWRSVARFDAGFEVLSCPDDGGARTLIDVQPEGATLRVTTRALASRTVHATQELRDAVVTDAGVLLVWEEDAGWGSQSFARAFDDRGSPLGPPTPLVDQRKTTHLVPQRDAVWLLSSDCGVRRLSSRGESLGVDQPLLGPTECAPLEGSLYGWLHAEWVHRFAEDGGVWADTGFSCCAAVTSSGQPARLGFTGLQSSFGELWISSQEFAPVAGPNRPLLLQLLTPPAHAIAFTPNRSWSLELPDGGLDVTALQVATSPKGPVLVVAGRFPGDGLGPPVDAQFVALPRPSGSFGWVEVPLGAPTFAREEKQLRLLITAPDAGLTSWRWPFGATSLEPVDAAHAPAATRRTFAASEGETTFLVEEIDGQLQLRRRRTSCGCGAVDSLAWGVALVGWAVRRRGRTRAVRSRPAD